MAFCSIQIKLKTSVHKKKKKKKKTLHVDVYIVKALVIIAKTWKQPWYRRWLDK